MSTGFARPGIVGGFQFDARAVSVGVRPGELVPVAARPPSPLLSTDDSARVRSFPGSLVNYDYAGRTYII